MTPIDKVSRALCQTFNGDADRLFDGLFTLPYEPITSLYDENKLYFYDALVTTDDGRQLPQIKNWRYWAYQAPYFMDNLGKEGFRITEKVGD
jgi:hypothetical protein